MEWLLQILHCYLISKRFHLTLANHHEFGVEMNLPVIMKAIQRGRADSDYREKKMKETTNKFMSMCMSWEN